MKTGDRYTCDHDTTRPGADRGWSVCGRRAVVGRRARGCALHYCERHRHIAENPPLSAFTPALGAETFEI